MMNPKFAMLLLAMMLLGACSQSSSPAPAPASAIASAPAAAGAEASAEPAAAVAPTQLIPLETQRVHYACADGSEILLKIFDDQRARIDVDGAEQVLRPVPAEGGTLFLGDEVNLRIVGQEATLSRGGTFLKSACKLKTAA